MDKNKDSEPTSGVALMDPFGDVVEIVECGWRRANQYLGQGYRLLAMNVTTYQKEGPNGWFVRRGFTYVMGRSTETAYWEPPPRDETSERKE